MAAIDLRLFDQWLAGTLQNSIPANDNALRNEALAAYVISKATTAQPGSPANGDCYIIPAGATGAQWATFTEDNLALYRDGTWYEFEAFEGLIKNVAGTIEVYNGSTWGAAGSDLPDEVVREIRSVPQNSQSTAYTLVLADAGKHILHPSADTTARTFTIPANSSVPYEIGTAITFVNQNGAGVVTISINTDTMRLAGAGTTGSRTLAANGIATALKITSTEWIISGTGLT